jgi:DNA-binding MarR family transcriptional regulator
VLAVLPASSPRHRHQIDYLGAALLAGFAVCVVLASSMGGTSYSWGSPVIIALFAAAAALLVAWWLAERHAVEPVLSLNMFKNKVFTVSSGIGFAAGFAMFGALSYLPLFLQVVHRVSPTISGVYLLPMVLGLLITSIGSGQLIARTGRYKVYPIVGTATLAVALYLLSRLDENTPTLVMNLYFFILGFSLGLILQVLVIAVQNSVSFADLGAATSGVTFFRTIGGSFGVSVFGAIFTNQLVSQLTAALRGVHLPPGFNVATVQSDTSVLKKLPAAVQHDILHAYSAALHPVFLTAVPIALVAFVLSWFLREVPLRTTTGEPTAAAGTVRSSASAVDLGQGLGAAPTQRNSDEEAERISTRLSAVELRRFGYARLARAAGLDLSGGACWILTRLARQGATPGAALAEQAGVTVEEGHPSAEQLVSRGLITRSPGGMLALTPDGRVSAEKLIAAQHDWLEQQLAGWSPEQNAELSQVLAKLCRSILGDEADRHVLKQQRPS